MIEDLQRQGLIKIVPVDKKKIQDARDLALRDIATSRSLLANNQDWAYTIAYHAVLQAGRALMFSQGYRPDGANQHVSVVKFVELYLDKKMIVLFLTACGVNGTVRSMTRLAPSRIVKQRLPSERQRIW